MKAAVVVRAEHVMQVLVMDDRQDEEGRDGGRVQPRMDADLIGVVVVRTEANGAASLAGDLLAPLHRKRGVLEEIGAVDFSGQRKEMVMSVIRQGERKRPCLHPRPL